MVPLRSIPTRIVTQLTQALRRPPGAQGAQAPRRQGPRRIDAQGILVSLPPPYVSPWGQAALMVDVEELDA